MATWLVKIDGFVPGKYIGTKTEKGKEMITVSWSKFEYNGPYAPTLQTRHIKSYPIEQCTLIRKPGKKEMKLYTWIAWCFMSYTKWHEWKYDQWDKYN